MKLKQFILLLIGLISGLAFSQKDQSKESQVDISIEIKDFAEQQVYLIGIVGDQYYKADSSVVSEGGKIAFKRTEKFQPGFYYLYDNKTLSMQLLIDQDQEFSMSTALNDLVGKMEVNGSLDNELLYQNLKFEAKLQPKFQEIANQMKMVPEGSEAHAKLIDEQNQLLESRKEHVASFEKNYPDAFFTKFKYAGQNPEVKKPLNSDGTVNTDLQVYFYRNELWDNVDWDDERLLRTPIVINKLKKYMFELTVQSADSVIASADKLIGQVLDRDAYYQFFCNWIAMQYDPEKSTIMDPQAVRVHLTKNYFTHERAFWFKDKSYEIDRLQQRAKEMELSLVGLKGPDVIAADNNGIKRRLYDIKSPYVIVYLYNPTCEHCMEETPKLMSFYEEWNKSGVEVYAIALHTDDEEWKGYIESTGMSWINVFDPTNKAIYGKYYVDVTPEIYVLNPDRTIIAKNLKTHQIADVIQRDRQK